MARKSLSPEEKTEQEEFLRRIELRKQELARSGIKLSDNKISELVTGKRDLMRNLRSETRMKGLPGLHNIKKLAEVLRCDLRWLLSEPDAPKPQRLTDSQTIEDPSDDTKATALSIAPEAPLGERLEAYFGKCEEKLGFVPNVLKAYAFNPVKLQAFADMYNDLMLADSGLSKLEREMIGVVVSSANHCYYCLVAHGAAVRQLSGDPQFGEMLVANYRAAELSPRQRGMLDFAWKLTASPHEMDEPDRAALRTHGFSDRDIWDISAVAAFFNMTNRMASAVDMRPNPEYHALARG
jgi:uncharacterized peroxidase-related enzyme